MKPFYILALLLIPMISLSAQSKDAYTDFKPVYRKWQDGYILDKIEYTKNSTIFYFRFVCRNGQGITAIFYPPGGQYPWYLKGNSGRDYNLKALKNIRRNNELLSAHLYAKQEYPSLDGYGYCVFSCEAHFERLPNTEKMVDMIEGYGQEMNQNHFNCFDVTMKTWDDEALGEEKDSEEKVKKFENKYGISNPAPKPKPKIEVKPAETKDTVKVTPLVPLKEKIDTIKKVEIKPKAVLSEDPDNPYPIPRLRSKEDLDCNRKLVLSHIIFQDNSVSFSSTIASKETLYILHDYLKERPQASVTLIGHTDIFGKPDKNMELSRQRAVSVQRWLSMMGIHPKRIKIEYKGPSQPLFPKGNALNRRVELILHCN